MSEKTNNIQKIVQVEDGKILAYTSVNKPEVFLKIWEYDAIKHGGDYVCHIDLEGYIDDDGDYLGPIIGVPVSITS